MLQLRTHRVPLSALQESLERFAIQEGFAIDSRLYAFALGLSFAHGGEPLLQPSGRATKRDGDAASAKGVGKGLPPRRRAKDGAAPVATGAPAATPANAPADVGPAAPAANRQETAPGHRGAGATTSGEEDSDAEAERVSKDIYSFKEITSTLREWAGNWDWTQGSALILASGAALAVGSLLGASMRKA